MELRLGLASAVRMRGRQTFSFRLLEASPSLLSIPSLTLADRESLPSTSPVELVMKAKSVFAGRGNEGVEWQNVSGR